MSGTRDTSSPGGTGGAARAGSLAGGVGVLVGLVGFALLAGSGILSGGEIRFGAGSDERAEASGPPATPTQAPVRPSEPTSLVVPSVGIEAAIRPVGLDPDLALRPPRDPELVGWWDESAEPGAGPEAPRGGTVIAGHTVHDPDADTSGADTSGADDGANAAARTEDADAASGGGAMDRLPQVRKDAKVLVRTEQGTVRYRVSRVVHSSKSRLAEQAERIFDQRRPHRLVLVTCEDWNGEEYLSNVVIFAQPLPVVE